MPQSEPGQFVLAPCVSRILLALACAFLVTGASQPAHSQTYHVIYDFADSDAGLTPYAGPTLDRAGNLYGTTYLGGRFGSGSVYKLSAQGDTWTFTSLYSFIGGGDGAAPGFGALAF